MIKPKKIVLFCTLLLTLLALLFARSGVAKAPGYFFELFVPHAQILFVGDLFFDRQIRLDIESHGGDYIFSCIDSLLQKPDRVVGNLEGPITDNSSVSVHTTPEQIENFRFTFPPSTAALLATHNITLVSIGNNHIMNFGRDGLEQTKKYLTQAGVQFFGDPDASEDEKVARVVVNSVPLSFVNWSDWTSDKTDHTAAQVAKEVAAGRIPIVYAHWGDEYLPPPERVKNLAHRFVDAGAAAVFGSHPHIVQAHEVYNGKDIYYSLGNFIFDQYWDSAVTHGLAVLLTISKDGTIAATEYPVELQKDGRTCPLVE